MYEHSCHTTSLGTPVFTTLPSSFGTMLLTRWSMSNSGAILLAHCMPPLPMHTMGECIDITIDDLAQCGGCYVSADHACWVYEMVT